MGILQCSIKNQANNEYRYNKVSEMKKEFTESDSLFQINAGRDEIYIIKKGTKYV